MQLMDKPTLTGGLLVAGLLLLASLLPAAAEERRHEGAFSGQTFGSDMRQVDDQRRRYGDDRMRWQYDRERRHDDRYFERNRRDFEYDRHGPYRDGRWHEGREDHGYRDDPRGEGHHPYDRYRYRDHHGDRDRPGAWAPNIDVIVDGISVDNRRLPDNPEGGPDRCHQLRSDTWSTSQLECPDPVPPARDRVWSSSPRHEVQP